MKRIILLLSIVTCFNCFSQTIDSVHFSYNDSNQEILGFIEGDFIWLNTDTAITNINDSTYSDTILIRIYFLPCQYWNIFAPYDTTFIRNTPLVSGNWHVKILSIQEQYLDSTSCFYNKTEHIVDTAFFDLNIPIGIEEYLNGKINIYPNPITQSFRIENLYALKIESLIILDNTGKYIGKLEPAGLLYDVSHLNQGLYIIEITTNKGVLRKKIVKK